MEHLLDIITITKNDIEGLKRTLQSTRRLRIDGGLRQIVVDGSSEECREKILNLIRTEVNIDYVWQQKPAGTASGFNYGLNFTTATWIWFLNGGDEAYPDIEVDKFLYLVKNSSADIVIFQNEIIQTGKIVKHPPIWDRWPGLFTWIPHQATLSRKSLFERYGRFDQSLPVSTDSELWIRWLSKDIVVDTISIPLARYDTTGISHTRLAQTFDDNIRIIERHLNTMVRIWLINGFNILKAWYYFLKSSDRKKIFAPLAKFIAAILYVGANGIMKLLAKKKGNIE